MSSIDTIAVHAGYQPENSQPRALPIYQSTTFHYSSVDEVAGLFDLSVPGYMYSRIHNPTCSYVEKKIAAMEGGVGALLTTSGQAATLVSVMNLCSAGDHLVSSATIYGGTVNLLAVTLKRFGIETTFVSPRATVDEIRAAVRPNTKLIFGETVANPALAVLDIETFATAAHAEGLPLVIDNTFPTPVLCRPIEWGADVVVHSTTKYMDGHATFVGGVVVDSGNFDWEAHADKFPGLTEPDESYHGVTYTRDFGKAAFITKAQVQLTRDLGIYPPAIAAFALNQSLESLPVRIRRHTQNAQRVAEWLEAHPKIASVNFPGLASSPDHDLAQKYLPEGVCGVISFVVDGGRDRAAKLLDSLKLAAIEVHVADSRTCVLHPASSTHRQLTDEQLVACGVEPGMIRFSCGLEDPEDIIADLEQALAQI
ncbi:MAG: O-acetylhomoserine aminocarboxypropyltransferase/cysteine synthase [Coriobacteriales bacterium]|nr:O-acetylhomoserine aminocarboxypropyltransferase/cysteine synthase [Coriobacteriales bacterium]MDO5709660.1 O-acetylhomoserine aminocarboxypropyltransferase/cysteine synthase [Coriobacteriales bacterium]